MSYEKRSKHLEIEVDREYRHRVPKRTKDGLVWEVQGMSYWVTGCIWIDVSITRDTGYYGGRSDDYPGDPDEVCIEELLDYELTLTELHPDGMQPKHENGTYFTMANPMLDEDFVLGLVGDSTDLEVDFCDCD